MELIQVPDLDALKHLNVTIEVAGLGEEVSVSATSRDGRTVTLTWDEITSLISIEVARKGSNELRLARARIVKVTVREDGEDIVFGVQTRSDELGGVLRVRIRERVHIEDTLLDGLTSDGL